MKARSDVLVVIPAFNEEATVAQVVRGVREAGFPVLVVDDGSHDQTSQRARLAGARVVRLLPINLGVGGALRCGFRWALKNGYSAVVQCDADGQHPPHQIESLVNFAESNDLHLAIGSRFLGNSEFTSSSIRRIPMRLMAIFASKSADVQLTRQLREASNIIGRPTHRHIERISSHSRFPSSRIRSTIPSPLPGRYFRCNSRGGPKSLSNWRNPSVDARARWRCAVE